MFIIDLDDFKKVNDFYGYNVGDGILVEFVWFMKQVFCQFDYVVCWGGEEFVVVVCFINREEVVLLVYRMFEVINIYYFRVSDIFIFQ